MVVSISRSVGALAFNSSTKFTQENSAKLLTGNVRNRDGTDFPQSIPHSLEIVVRKVLNTACFTDSILSIALAIERAFPSILTLPSSSLKVSEIGCKPYDIVTCIHVWYPMCFFKRYVNTNLLFTYRHTGRYTLNI